MKSGGVNMGRSFEKIYVIFFLEKTPPNSFADNDDCPQVSWKQPGDEAGHAFHELKTILLNGFPVPTSHQLNPKGKVWAQAFVS